MRPVSARFLAAVTGSHQMVSRATLLTVSGQNGVTPTGTVLPIVQGDVKLDSTANVRGTIDLTTTATWGSILPYGHEIYIERGIVYGNQDTEWVGQGYYRVDEITQQNAPLGTLTLTGSDRMAYIVDGRVPTPQVFVSGTSIQTVFQTLVLDVQPLAQFDADFAWGSTTLTSDYVCTDDRYAFLKDIADSLGKIMYWDYRGRFQLRSAPSVTTPVANIYAGKNGVLVSAQRQLTRQGIYNGVVASGQQTSDQTPPVSALVIDSNPNSPTYWFGPFGKVPKFYSSSFLVTQSQCSNAAAAMIATVTGRPYNVNFGMVPNPALEPLDPVSVKYSDSDGGATHVLTSVTIPLDHQATMTGTTKQVIF
jgi:hypothetical protein